MNNDSESNLLRRPYTVLLTLMVWIAVISPAGLHANNVDLDHKIIPKVEINNSALKLVGTAVSGDSDQSVAVIEDFQNRRQWLFNEGDRAGDILIKTIHRDHIIINAGDGDQKVKISGFLGKVAPPIPEKVQDYGPSMTRINKVSSRMRQYVIDRNEAQAALANPKALLDQITIKPGHFFSRELGFRIADFDKTNILSKMGLRSGDLILAINDHEIAGPQEAVSLFETLREQGDIDLTVRRRARTYQINLLLQ